MTFALDCPDAVALAEFYAALLGWRVDRDPTDDGWVEVHPPIADAGASRLAFQQVSNYRAPEWPDGPTPQQAHLDFSVPDLDGAAAVAVGLGAVRHSVQPSETGNWVVFSDPAGHLFCLCRHSD
ncbi:VOC family protein [Nonlabens tegetincola]